MSSGDALAESQLLAAAEGLAEISPFDDARIVTGQGTIGLEMMEFRPDMDMVLVPLSGGGLAAAWPWH